MKVLTLDEMKTLPTRRLLAYKRKLYSHHPSVEDWTFDCSCPSCLDTQAACQNFDYLLRVLKEILATREHVSTPGKLAVSAARRAWHADIKERKAIWARRYSNKSR